MVLRLVHLWNTAAGVELALMRNARRMAGAVVAADADDDPDDPQSDRARERRKEQQREQEAALDRDRDERRTKKREGEEADDSNLMFAWLASDEYRRSFEQLSNDIADARLATMHAYDRAVMEQQRAEDDLQDARDRAIVLPDGRRAYFTRDGRRLYGENDQQITDTSVIAHAESLHARKPDATTYEEYVERRIARTRAEEKADQLRSAIVRLDTLADKIKDGGLNRAQLEDAQKEQQKIVALLPPDAREEYQRLRAARKDGPRLSNNSADAVFTSAPDLNNDFRQAQARLSAAAKDPETESADLPTRRPVVTSAPDF
jgi:hypothetical protein